MSSNMKCALALAAGFALGQFLAGRGTNLLAKK